MQYCISGSKEGFVNLSSKKATRISDIPAKILKINNDLYLKDVTSLKNIVLKGVFSDKLKFAYFCPAVKRGGSQDKENYGHCGILSCMLEVFERINDFM